MLTMYNSRKFFRDSRVWFFIERCSFNPWFVVAIEDREGSHPERFYFPQKLMCEVDVIFLRSSW